MKHKIVFSDSSSESSNSIVVLTLEKPQLEENIPDDSSDEYINGDNPFVLQDSSPFEISSSESFSEPNENNKIVQSSQIESSVEQFYYQNSKSFPLSNSKSSYKTYNFTYCKKETIKGSRFHFQLTHEGIPLFHTKTKSRHPKKPSVISSGVDCHFSQNNFEGIVKCDQKRHIFSLHQHTIQGPELLTMKITPVKGPVPKNTRIVIHNFQNHKNELAKDLILVNLKPTFDSNGHWNLSFGGKIAIPSVKNCILVKEGSEEAFMSIRRISHSQCEVDASNTFSPLWIFAIVMSSFFSTI
ncbi:hypothetical protein TRFO_39944 [Tritrichomonas foetus]|uniref:Tubby C-terminal domain-containing protein n=1 Tax=Tritrichomonas foetus TaxID=1144522 RepID=A0A1J4J5E1_9EUKA|nr:hypothetical protein TRFO_39944 [Tritrichomonas foetus]|eukprot:OHS93905.1 hypothetical protein TRFO_39944 [Tritrichomonas foetus]